MRIKTGLVVIVAAFGLLAQWNAGGENVSGYLDTSAVDGFRADSLKWSKPFSLSAYENLRVRVKMNDTSAAGFKNDSIKAQWGFQTFGKCLNSSLAADTCADGAVVVDTVTKANLGTMTYGTMDTAGTIYRRSGLTDTIMCAGWAVQSRNVSPEFDTYIRFFTKGLTGNKVGSFVKVQFDVLRRVKVKAGN